MVIAIAAIVLTTSIVSCKSNNKKQITDWLETNQTTESSDSTIQVPVADTVNNINDTITVEEKVFTTIHISNVAIPVEIYEATDVELPSDSILALAGIKIERTDRSVTLSTDSSQIPQDIVVTKQKGIITVTQYGNTTSHKGEKVSIDDRTISIDGKVIEPEKILAVLRIGVPKETPIIVDGGSQNITSTVLLGNADINVTGNGNIKLTTVKNASISQKGGCVFTADDIPYLSTITLNDSASVKLNRCDSITAVRIAGKGILTLPSNTAIAKEKISGDGDIVKK